MRSSVGALHGDARVGYWEIERCSIDRERNADGRGVFGIRDSIITMNKNLIDAAPVSRGGLVPHLKTSKIGIVSRDYSRRDSNRFRDFSKAFPEILKLLDQRAYPHGVEQAFMPAVMLLKEWALAPEVNSPQATSIHKPL